MRGFALTWLTTQIYYPRDVNFGTSASELILGVRNRQRYYHTTDDKPAILTLRTTLHVKFPHHTTVSPQHHQICRKSRSPWPPATFPPSSMPPRRTLRSSSLLSATSAPRTSRYVRGAMLRKNHRVKSVGKV